jgi:hypothetical protein
MYGITYNIYLKILILKFIPKQIVKKENINPKVLTKITKSKKIKKQKFTISLSPIFE